MRIRPRPIIARATMIGWIDLLGYGGQIAEANFDPKHPRAKTPINRLRKFHKIVREHSSSKFRTLTINDGAAAYRDHHKVSPKFAYDFIRQCWKLFKAVQEQDPIGARMVIATGQRAMGSRAGIEQVQSDFSKILNRFSNGEISLDEAHEKAQHVQRYSDIIPQLQSNYAFSKAYIIEESGSTYNIQGQECYIDLDFFINQETNPTWITTDTPVYWEKKGLTATVAPIKSINKLEKYTPSATHLLYEKRKIDKIRKGRDW